MQEKYKNTVLLGFKPENKDREAEKELNIFFINNSSFPLKYTLTQRWAAGKIIFEDEIKKKAWHLLNRCTLQDLEGSKGFDLTIEKGGSSSQTFHRHLSIKLNRILDYYEKLPVINQSMYGLDCFPQTSLSSSSERQVDTTDYRQKEGAAEPMKEKLKQLKRQWLTKNRKSNYKASATPPPQVVDLHIEQLTKSEKEMSNHEILTIQLQYMEKMLERAVTHDYNKITFIHGVGKGTLRREIFNILEHHPQVKTFNNRYQPGYGFGATEVFL